MALLYGKPIADTILAETKKLIETAGIRPGLAVVLVGEDPSSHLYVTLKEKAAHDVGIHFEKFLFPSSTRKETIIECINVLNQRDDIHGIIVQVPLPDGLDTDAIIVHIDPSKDTDGFHHETLKRFLAGDKEACPVFPRAVIELLHAANDYRVGDKGLVLANSDLLGKVMVQALALDGLQAEYILSGEKREHILAAVKKARVIVTACGIAHLIIGEMVADDVIVIDGGISHLDGKIIGDVDRVSVEKKVHFLSPVPGGVGPVTVASLLARVTDAVLQN